jgi:4-alpha-glucanotransferase
MLSPNLARLAEAYGLELSYMNPFHKTCHSPPESVIAVLRLLGASLDREDQAVDALREHQQAQWRHVLDSIVLAWDGNGGEAILRLPADSIARPIPCSLEMENGQTTAWNYVPANAKPCQSVEVAGVAYHEYRLPMPSCLPLGYHRLQLEIGGQQQEATVIAAPTKCYRPEEDTSRNWGVFLPLYALRSSRDCGVGDFSDLGNLLTWTHEQGGSMVGTLPLMASFIYRQENIFDPSPYAPASRLFWNEAYLDVDRIAASAECPAAKARLTSEDFQRERTELQRLSLVDYQRVMSLKRSVLMELATAFFAQPSSRGSEFRAFVEKHPRVEDYARFRATCERQGASWWCWPDRQRLGDVRQGDFDEAVRRYHLYVQWQCHEQLSALQECNGQKGLYLDLPLGSSSDSYDVWRERELFVFGTSVGAPRDTFAVHGQNWGFLPVHPQRQREHGYRFFREVLGNMMQFARMLRIDHMPSLHRLFYIPQGASASDGVYVKYPHEELYSIFCLESHRHRVVLMGEDAGTLPPSLIPAMNRHQINHMYMAQCYYLPKADGSPPAIPENSVASLSTHDLATFASFWRGLELEDRLGLGLLDRKMYKRNVRGREHTRLVMPLLLSSGKKRGIVQRIWHRAASELASWLPASWLRRRWTTAQEFAILKSLLKVLAESRAHAVIVNLEDLWLSAEAQNVPGTWKERPNWQRRAAYALEDFSKMPEVCETLQEINRLRRTRESIDIGTIHKQSKAA